MDKISLLTAGLHWKLKISLLCVVYCIGISMPNYTNFNAARLERSRSYSILIENYRTLNSQIDHPFRHNEAATSSHASKLDFRFVPALLAKAIPSRDLLTRMLGLYIINNIAGFAFFLCILQLVFQYTGNRLFASLAALNFAVLYIGKSFFHDTLLWNDGIAFTLLALALLSRRWPLTAACLLLAFFTDERALFAALPAFVFRRLSHREPGAPGLFRSALPFLSAYLLYALIRELLKRFAGLETPVSDGSGVSLFLRFQKEFPAWLSVTGGLLAYKSAWWLIIFAAWWLRIRKPDAIIYYFGLLALLVISVSVQDLTRSLAYAFIAPLTGICLLYEKYPVEEKPRALYCLFIIFIVNLCIPTVQITYIRNFKIFPPVYKLIWPDLHSI
jgi:hypothetical protein